MFLGATKAVGSRGEDVIHRTLRRRVPVLRLGSRNPGDDQKSLRFCPQAFASVRKPLQGFASLRKPSRVSRLFGNRTSSRNAELSHFLRLAFQNCQQSQGSGGVVVPKRRAVVTFGFASCRRVPKVSVTGIGRGSGRETQICRHFWVCPLSSCAKSANRHRDRRVHGRERRTVVTFGFALHLRVSKVPTGTGIGGFVVANAELSSRLGLPPVVACQTCEHAWSALIRCLLPLLLCFRNASKRNSLHAHGYERSYAN